MCRSTLEEWYIKGIKAGERKYEREGEIKRGILNILKILNIRFKKVPRSISRAVNSYKDPIALDSLLELAITCKSLAEFEQNLAHR
ncbi:MAG: hypothetical protein LBP87_13290 [Planctomycetaceae bacterium]|jgi:hypothetical protein|nr:hypothetical protein [Planctomycetaceae bacterium]